MLSRFWRGLCNLPNLAVRAPQWRQFDLVQIRSDVAPGISAGLLNDAFSPEGQPTQRHMGVEAMDRPMIHRSSLQTAFERAPGLFDPVKLLVTQREVGWGEALVRAVDHTFAVEPLFRPTLRRINPQQPTLSQA